MRSRFQCHLLNATFTKIDQLAVWFTSQRCGEVCQHAFETGRNRDRFADFDGIEIRIDRVSPGIQNIRHNSLGGRITIRVHFGKKFAIA